jgi:hypothetical protein
VPLRVERVRSRRSCRRRSATSSRVDALAGIERRARRGDESLSAVLADEHHATSCSGRGRRRAVREQVVEHRHPHDEAGATCVSISASRESATRGSISTPRFIGPGCITFWPGRSRSGVTPSARCTRAARARSSRPPHPLALHAQDVDDVGAPIAPMSCVTSQPIASIPRGISVGGPTRSRARPSARAPGCRARDARVQHVADDRDVQALDAGRAPRDRVEVEQRLRRVLVLAVAGVDDVRLGARGDELRRADLRVRITITSGS